MEFGILRSPYSHIFSLSNSFPNPCLWIWDKDIEGKDAPMPLLDSALVFTCLGNKIHIIKENNNNIKVTTPEDYYILKAMLELEENRYVFGIN